MKKLYSLVLMAAMLLVGADAWAGTRTAGTFQELQDALTAAQAGDVIELTADIAYPTNGTGLVNINKSITLDGKGHKLSGYGTANISVSGTQPWPVTLAVNYQGSTSAALDVTIQNLHVSNKAGGDRSYGLMAYDGVDTLTLKNDTAYLGQSGASYKQPICFTGTETTPIRLRIEDSFIGCSAGVGYTAYILKPIKATLINSEFSGYCSMYFKYRHTPAYGNVAGARGSVVNAYACNFTSLNTYKGESNNFAIFPMEDDGITLNLHNCSFNAQNLEQNSNKGQRLVNLQYNDRPNGSTGVDVNINISGDNTHIYHIESANKLIWNGWLVGEYTPGKEGLGNQTFSDINVTISGGTLNINPEAVRWFVKADNKAKSTIDGTYSDQSTGTGAITIPVGYEVKEVSQGGTTVYRVVKKAAVNPKTSTLYDLNDAVETATEGANPVTSFELSTGENMTLNQQTTTAGYVEVKDNGSSVGTTVQVGKVVSEAKVDQILVVNNGLDVQGSSKVNVQAGSALVVGDGGIVTANSGNIVLNADKNDGCASLLLDPAVTVNQTPKLTVKMKAEGVGRDLTYNDQYWHRFAMPVASISSLPQTPSIATAIYGWDYENQYWYPLSGVADLEPFAGYALTVNNNGLIDVEYTFEGNLTGNIDKVLDFSHQGYNFFGNSYTGYIKVSYLATEILGNADIDGSIWMWNPATQTYAAVGLQSLKNAENTLPEEALNYLYPKWQREIAPMQTFIFRLPNTTSAEAMVNYEETIWKNPRYPQSTTSPAPARVNSNIEGTIVRLSVADANGNGDEMLFMEKDAYSDAYDRGYDATKYMNNNSINMYTIINGEKLSSIATDNLNGMAFDIDTKDAISYTMTINAVLGDAEYAIKDIVTNSIVTLTNGNTYTFTAQPNSTVAGRFTFVPIQNMPTDVETVEAVSNVRGIYTITGQYVGEDFDILPAGVYVVDGVKIVK